MNFVSNLLASWKNPYGTPYEFCRKIPDFMEKFIIMILHTSMNFVPDLLISWNKSYGTPYEFFRNNFLILWSNSYGTSYEFCHKFPDFIEKFIWYPIWILFQICWFYEKIHMVPHMIFFKISKSYGRIYMVPPMNFVPKFLISWENHMVPPMNSQSFGKLMKKKVQKIRGVFSGKLADVF